MALRVLIVDDDPTIRETLQVLIESDGHAAVAVDSASEAIALVGNGIYDLVFLDLRLGDDSGLDLIAPLLDASPWIKIVLITAHGSVESALEATRKGAFDYVTKPFTLTHIRVVTERVARRRALEHRIESLEADRASLVPPHALSSRNPAMRRILEQAQRVAATDAAVLLEGESGSGKGVVARAIHDWSERASAPFATISCPSLAPPLLESELFGHVRGAFTGAISSKPGRVEVANGGTLLLDEVGDLPAELQPRLLRFLQTREYESVGDPVTRQGDVRVLAATNRRLKDAVKRGSFREDLYYRLNVVTLTVPPLRDRPEDVVDFAETFLHFFSARYDRPRLSFAEGALELIRSYEWPGNVRELQNAVERAAIMAHGDEIGPELFPQARDAAGHGGLPGVGAELVSLDEMEKRYIQHVLDNTESIEAAAETLGVAPSTLWRRRRKHGI